MKKINELSSVELQRILLACCNITVSARTISSQWNVLSRSQWNALSRSQWNALLRSPENVFSFRMRSFGVPLAFLQRSSSRSICVLVTRSLLGYFCPVLYKK